MEGGLLDVATGMKYWREKVAEWAKKSVRHAQQDAAMVALEALEAPRLHGSGLQGKVVGGYRRVQGHVRGLCFF